MEHSLICDIGKSTFWIWGQCSGTVSVKAYPRHIPDTAHCAENVNIHTIATTKSIKCKAIHNIAKTQATCGSQGISIRNVSRQITNQWTIALRLCPVHLIHADEVKPQSKPKHMGRCKSDNELPHMSLCGGYAACRSCPHCPCRCRQPVPSLPRPRRPPPRHGPGRLRRCRTSRHLNNSPCAPPCPGAAPMTCWPAAPRCTPSAPR